MDNNGRPKGTEGLDPLAQPDRWERLVSSIVMAASGRRVSELEWDLLMLIRPSRSAADAASA